MKHYIIKSFDDLGNRYIVTEFDSPEEPEDVQRQIANRYGYDLEDVVLGSPVEDLWHTYTVEF